MSTKPIPTRVRYYDRQFLQAADLRDDQDYHRQMRWRHNLALHSWGILAGLEVIPPTATSDTVTVSAGMALDGYGRELVLVQDATARQRFDQNQSYDVWLTYAETTIMPAAARGGCTEIREPARYQEQPQVQIALTSARQSSDVTHPNEVPAGDLNFGPERPPPDAARPWPVFLGRLDYRGSDGTGGWVVDSRERRYAGLIAERVVSRHPSDDLQGDDTKANETQLVIGTDADYPDYRFAVTPLHAADPDGEDAEDVPPPFLGVRQVSSSPDPSVPREWIELRSDRVTAAGDLVLLDGAAVEFRQNPVGTNPHAGRLTGSEYWRIYHHFEPPPPAKKATGSPEAVDNTPPTPPESFKDELRITMPSTPAGGNRVVIGCFTDKGKFEPVMVVKDDKSVEVYGSLIVKGRFEGIAADVPDGTAVGGAGPTSEEVFEQLLTSNRLTVRDAVTGLVEFDLPAFATAVGNLGAMDRDAFGSALWNSSPDALGRSAVAGSMKNFVGALPKPQLKALIEAILDTDAEQVVTVVGTPADGTPAARRDAVTRLAALAGKIFDGEWDTSSAGEANPRNIGKDAIASAMEQGFPNLLQTLTLEAGEAGEIPPTARLRAFFHYVQAQAGDENERTRKFKQLRDAIQLLAEHFDEL